MKNLKGVKICLETYDLKPNYSALGQIIYMPQSVYYIFLSYKLLFSLNSYELTSI